MRQCPRCRTAYGDEVTTCPLDGAALTGAAREDPLLNRVIKDRYRIVGRLGDGGMGAVYRAEQLSVGRTVALKVLHREFARDEEFVQRFHQEARLAAGLNHPRLTTVFDFDQSEDGSLFIVMEFLEGTRLSDVIRTAAPLEVGRAIRLGIEIAEGIEAAHAAGVIHRDVKPQNIMVLPSDHVKLMDFGIARSHDGGEVHLTRAGTMMGTPLYMAPEQIEGRPVSQKTDIYAFGIVLYEMLSGQTPFAAPTSAAVLARQLNEPPRPLRAVRPEVPALLEQIVMQALEKEPEYRQERIGEVVRRLRTVAGSIPSAGGPPAGAPDETQASAPTVVSGAGWPAAAPSALGGETLAGAPTMVAQPVGARTGVVSPGAPGASRWAWLRGGAGKALAISAAVVIVAIVAVLVWRMTREPSNDSKPVVAARPPIPSPAPAPPPAIPAPGIASVPTPPSSANPVPPRPPVLPAVTPPASLPPPPTPRPQPSEIRAAVEQQLRAAKLLHDPPNSEEPGVDVKAVTQDGRVTLIGVLANLRDRQRAREITGRVGGVTAVVDTEVNVIGEWK